MARHKLSMALGAAIITSLAIATSLASAAEAAKTYKVFIFAGQSNAQGKIDKPTLDYQAEAPQTRDLYRHLRKDGEWLVRDDVLATYQNNRTGPLTLGFGSSGRTGAELEFGWMMGDHFEEPVVILKTCQGGISLYQGFRPPSAGMPNEEKLQAQLAAAQARAKARNEPVPALDDITNRYGEWYRLIFSDLRALSESWGREFPALNEGDGKYYNIQARNWEKDFPALEGRKPELAGLVWFQGWNDQYGGAEQEYESNLKHFIADVRRDSGVPHLPVVIVAMGQNGSKPATGPMLTIRDAQMAMNDVPEFQGNVRAFRSDLLVDKDAERLHENRRENPEEWKKYGTDDAYHYFGSPIWYMRIGRAAGEAMLELLNTPGA